MSVFAPIRINKSNKVHYTEYIRTENGAKPDEAAPKLAEPVNPDQPEAK